MWKRVTKVRLGYNVSEEKKISVRRDVWISELSSGEVLTMRFLSVFLSSYSDRFLSYQRSYDDSVLFSLLFVPNSNFIWSHKRRNQCLWFPTSSDHDLTESHILHPEQKVINIKSHLNRNQHCTNILSKWDLLSVQQGRGSPPERSVSFLLII